MEEMERSLFNNNPLSTRQLKVVAISMTVAVSLTVGYGLGRVESNHSSFEKGRMAGMKEGKRETRLAFQNAISRHKVLCFEEQGEFYISVWNRVTPVLEATNNTNNTNNTKKGEKDD